MSGPMQQLDMFSRARRRRTDPSPPSAPGSSTSCLGAEQVRPRVPHHRALVLGFIRERGSYGATREEVAIALFASAQNRVTGRVRELLERELIRVADTTRQSSSGVQVEVLVARVVS